MDITCGCNTYAIPFTTKCDVYNTCSVSWIGSGEERTGFKLGEKKGYTRISYIPVLNMNYYSQYRRFLSSEFLKLLFSIINRYKAV